MSGASEGANGRASGLVLLSRFSVVLDYGGEEEKGNAIKGWMKTNRTICSQSGFAGNCSLYRSRKSIALFNGFLCPSMARFFTHNRVNMPLKLVLIRCPRRRHEYVDLTFL